MDLKAKYLADTCSDPIEFLNQLRQTTEPIGGSTVYSADGELVEYEVAVEAVKKANSSFIEKNSTTLEETGVDLELITGWFDHIAQIADNRMTLTGQRMTDSHALDEIKCLAKKSSEFITKYYKAQKG